MSAEAYADGDFVAQHLNNGFVPDERIQPNGVDIGISEVWRTSGYAEILEDEYSKPDRTEMRKQEDGNYRLYPGTYIIVYDYEVEIPEGHVGRVFPRSRLMRSGLHLTSALWDSGYEGIGEGLLKVPQTVRNVKLDPEAAIGQMCFLSANTVQQYEGSHQAERLVNSKS